MTTPKPRAMSTGNLSSSIGRAEAFAASLYPGDLIHEVTGFTVDDLRVIIDGIDPRKTASAAVDDTIQDELGDLA